MDMARRAMTSGDTKLPALKKKLFIAASYLAVAGLLLLLASYGQYRIKIAGDVNMPAAKTIEASLTVSYDLDTESTVDLSGYLIGLRPGDRAATFASSPDSANCVTLTVKNASEDARNTEVPLQYSLRIHTLGRLPLQFVLQETAASEGEGSNDPHVINYFSTYADGVYRFMDGPNEDASEIVFTLGTDANESNTHRIYVGWADSDGTFANARATADGSYRKEVELLELRAEAWGMSLGDGFHYENEQALQNMIQDPRTQDGEDS